MKILLGLSADGFPVNVAFVPALCDTIIAEPKRKGVPPDLLLDAECELWPMNSQVCRIHKSWSDFCDHSDRFADVYSSCQPQREGIGARLQIKPAGNSVR